MITSEWSYDPNMPSLNVKELREEIETLKLELTIKEKECNYVTQQLQERNKDWQKAEDMFNQLMDFIDNNEPEVVLAELADYKKSRVK